MNLLKTLSMTALAGSILLTGNAADAKEYTVKSGDSLSKIAKTERTSVYQIKKLNKLKSNLIHPGQKLQINNQYIIKPGDTLFKIAKKYNTTVEQLKIWNNLNSDLIIAGKPLIIDGSKQVQTFEVKPYQEKAQVQPAQAQPKQYNQTYQAPKQNQTYQASKQVQTYQAPKQVQQYSAPKQNQTYQAPKQNAASYATNSSVDAHLKQIMMRESGGNPRAVNPSGYYGLFQFSPQTWAAVGGQGNPANASAEEQWKRARILYTQYGAQHWSTAY